MREGTLGGIDGAGPEGGNLPRDLLRPRHGDSAGPTSLHTAWPATMAAPSSFLATRRQGGEEIRQATGQPEPVETPFKFPTRPLIGGLGKAHKPNARKQKREARKKGTGVNHFDLAALKAKNEAAQRERAG
jgi:hypothetical protein